MTRRDLARAALDAFTPHDAREAGFLARMKDLVGADGDPMSRDHFAPGHFTASSFIVSPDRQHVLLIFHGKLHLWLQPGGHVDPEDSDFLAAARREAAEEVHLADLELALPGIFDVDIHAIPARKSDPQHFHFDVRYAFVAPSMEVTADSDALDAKWVRLDAMDTVKSDESVQRAIRKLRAAFNA